MTKRYSISTSLYDTLKGLNKLISLRDEKYDLLSSEYPDKKLKKEQYDRYKKRVISIQDDFEVEWLNQLVKLDTLCQRIRKKQPHLIDLQERHINKSNYYPDAIVFGQIILSYENWKGYVPRLFSFPFRKSFWLFNNKNNNIFINQFLLRVMYSLPPKLLNLIVIDPLKLGESVKYFKPFLDISYPFREKKILTRADEIEIKLKELLDYIEDLIQYKFVDEVNNWIDFNKSSSSKLEYKILVIFALPEQISSNSEVYLKRLVDLGPRCGVLPILIINESVIKERKYEPLKEHIFDKAESMEKIFLNNIKKDDLSSFSIDEDKEIMPDSKLFMKYVNWLYPEYEKCEQIIIDIEDLWSSDLLQTGNSGKGLTIPIGWNNEGKEVIFSLGCVDSEHHALIAGRSGSGKSNLLHILIHGLTDKYSSDDLELYLLDYKQGIEFNIYTNPLLPHAKLIAVESSPEYGITVLRHLVDKINSRAILFKSNNTKDIYEYSEKVSSIPRILLIIDEFQILFTENREISELAEKMLTQILRQGRSYGIHIIFATQTLKGIQTQSITQLMSQVGCRIALACSEEDSSAILGSSSNYEAATLKSPPEGILNSSSGLKKENKKFIIPFVSPSIALKHQEEIYKKSKKENFIFNTKIFCGSVLPSLPSVNSFKDKFLDSHAIRLFVGEKLSFETEQFSISLKENRGENLLIAGVDNKLHNGLLQSILKSINYSNNVDNVLYFNAKNDLEIESIKVCENILIHNREWEGDLSQIVADVGKKSQIVIIDGLDISTMFQPSPPVYSPPSKDKKATPYENLKYLLEFGSQKGTHIIAFVDNWKRCSSSCRESLNYFDLRIGFNLNEDDAGSLISGSIGKFKGLVNLDKAVFVDKLQNNIELIRPYTEEGDRV